MNFDFPTILVSATFITGVIWAMDAYFWAPQRKQLSADAIDNGKKPQEAQMLSKEPVIVEYAKSFFPVILAVLVLRSFLVEPFRIPSGSMMPTLLAGDFILVNKFAYGIRLPVINKKIINIDDPETGDVAVFRYPKDPGVDYIKRIIGLPGDRIQYRNKVLTVNGKQVAQIPAGTYIGEGSAMSMSGASVREEMLGNVNHQVLVIPKRGGKGADLTVPEGHYFVMGDNRDNSNDSRYWGTVPDENLVGKAFMVWMNYDGAGSGVTWNRIGNSIK
ncbi:MAG: signal peptidase I [Gammaproteobacteria bacterium]